VKPTQVPAEDTPAPVAPQETIPEVSSYRKPQLFALGEACDLLQGGPPGGIKEMGIRRRRSHFTRSQVGN